MLSRKADYLYTFERPGEHSSHDLWVGCVCLVSNKTSGYATTDLLFVLSFLRSSSEKFKRLTWRGKKCRAPADSDTRYLSLNIWRHPTDYFITSLSVVLQEFGIYLLQFVTLSTVGDALVPALAFIARERFWSSCEQWMNFSFKVSDICFLKKLPAFLMNSSQEAILRHWRVSLSNPDANTTFSASYCSFSRITSIVLCSSINCFKTENLNSRNFKSVINAPSFSFWHSRRKHLHSSVFRTSSDLSPFSQNKWKVTISWSSSSLSSLLSDTRRLVIMTIYVYIIWAL